MIRVEEAQDIISLRFPRWSSEARALSASENFISAEEMVADRDYPPFDRVMMDGIALSYDAYSSGLRDFPIMGVCPAGEAARELVNEKACFEIMTGAPLPLKADLIIPYEHLKIEQGHAKISLETIRKRFDHVHAAGSDCKKGSVVLLSGKPLHGPHLGIAASFGMGKIFVQKKPKVLVVSTGDELVEVQALPQDHQIRRSNAHAIAASLKLHGIEDVTLAHLKDDAREIATHFQEQTQHFDMMIYSGGVSKGKFDYLPNVWTEMGVSRYFHEVSQRPGKPLWFGVDEKHHTAVIGLPGNPISSLICLHRYFLPQRPMFARLKSNISFHKSLTYFVPVKVDFSVDGILHATPMEAQNSGEFTALAGSDGFIELPREHSEFKVGESFSFYSWGKL